MATLRRGILILALGASALAGCGTSATPAPALTDAERVFCDNPFYSPASPVWSIALTLKIDTDQWQAIADTSTAPMQQTVDEIMALPSYIRACKAAYELR